MTDSGRPAGKNKIERRFTIPTRDGVSMYLILGIRLHTCYRGIMATSRNLKVRGGGKGWGALSRREGGYVLHEVVKVAGIGGRTHEKKS